jgi:hypothetical protein
LLEIAPKSIPTQIATAPMGGASQIRASLDVRVSRNKCFANASPANTAI